MAEGRARASKAPGARRAKSAERHTEVLIRRLRRDDPLSVEESEAVLKTIEGYMAVAMAFIDYAKRTKTSTEAGGRDEP